jgi:hypothetical protein
MPNHLFITGKVSGANYDCKLETEGHYEYGEPVATTMQTDGEATRGSDPDLDRRLR